MQYDIKKYLLLLALGAALGFSLGYPMQVMLVVAIIIIFWQIYNLEMIYRWVRKPNKNPLAETTGQIYLLHRELNSRFRKNKLRKRQLNEYLKQFRKAVSLLPDAIVLIDLNGKIQWANTNAEPLLGIRWPADSEVIFGDLIRDPLVEKLLSRTALSWQSSSLLENKHDDFEGIEIPSGKNRNLTINIKIIQYSDELRMVIARDVSRLLKINKMHTDFVANVSHELKTPLTVLKGYLEILQNQQSLPIEFAKPIAQMSSQSERMQLIVNDLLYLSKLEDHDNRAAHSEIEITHLINSIIESIQAKIAEKNHKIELDIDYQLKVLGNQNELHSAFSNLIFNAVNYTPKDGVISISWKKDTSSGYTGAEFCVTDNGPGIADNHIPRLTERFYRIDADRSREGGGTGLGLAIVKHVLQRHDGRLEIDSTVNSGSTFRCVFPSTKIFPVRHMSARG